MSSFNNYQPASYTNSQVAPKNKLWKWLIIGLFSLLAIIVLFKFLSGLGTGSLVINTSNKQATVKLAAYPDIQDKVAKVTAKLYKVGQSIRLPAGNYTVTVNSGEVTASKAVLIEAGEKTEVNLNLPANLADLEPVANIGTLQFTAGRTQLIYVDSRSSNLYKINSANQLGLLNNLALSTVQWADSSFGVAQDTVGTLYTITNGAVAPLNKLPAVNSESQPSFSVAPDHTIFLAYDKDVYIGKVGSSFKRLYTTNSAPISLVASNDHVAVISSPDESDIAKTVAIVSTSGSIKTKSDFGATISWSPSGKYFYADGNGPDQIYDSSFNAKFTLPSSHPKIVGWQNDQTFLYTQGEQLWQYKLTGSEARLVATAGKDQTIVAMTISDDKSYAYLTVQSNSGGTVAFSLYRYGLKGQNVLSQVQKLNNGLPWLTDGCFISLVNFTRPTITAVAGNSFTKCLDVAKKYVSDRDVSPGLFDYQLSNVLPSTPSPNN